LCIFHLFSTGIFILFISLLLLASFTAKQHIEHAYNAIKYLDYDVGQNQHSEGHNEVIPEASSAQHTILTIKVKNVDNADNDDKTRLLNDPVNFLAF
jgi:hypothetical protein